MKRMILIVCWILVILNVSAWGMPKVRATIEVVDEEGRPVPDAEVEVILFTEDGRLVGRSDSMGRFTVDSRTISLLRYGAVKEGFYGSGDSFDLGKTVPRGMKIRRRYPDVTRRIVIRPIVNPVPMYGYKFSSNMPIENEEVGLDLLKADWVAPHGKGEVVDVMVKILGSDNSKPNFRGGMTWRFPRKGDGMVRVRPEDCREESDFVMPRLAPDAGYISQWSAMRIREPKTMSVEMIPDGPWLHVVPYFFRIRTEMDEKGHIVKALYGKIIKKSYSIHWSAAYKEDPSRISFTYYVNPDGTRNMEFDPEKNLYKDIMPPKNWSNFPQWP